MLYKIVRVYQLKRRRYTLRYGLTLEQAQQHCDNPETSSSTCTTRAARQTTYRNGPWFDSYTEDK